ncbi:natural killer cells antigen CD94-like isoform X1 [Neoarius graeffei]|uniref:natural killer cells antigen CD94-like isoform X1 n=1 Tax=Neoarius graeffei TaxID=443677 RepID=UPI00298C1E20|nr:natural killer cells antigen CD94-like isoform X1 [Neoarius graeffei]
MDAEKVTEVEMKALTPEEVQDDKDAEKSKLEGTKEAENKSAEAKANEEKQEAHVYSTLKSPNENIYTFSTPISTPKRDEVCQEKEQAQQAEEAEANLYCKLGTPSENVYMGVTTKWTPEHNKDVYAKVHLYKRISAVFFILFLLLLAVTLALTIKLYEVQSSQKCPHPSLKVENNSSLIQVVHRCTECEKGWVSFKDTCYFISKDRLSWQESREKCQKQGGDLVVIDNEPLQNYLTKKVAMLYWIGLRYSEDQQWRWINNSTLTQSYWANDKSQPDTQGFCALLKGRSPLLNSWYTNSCEVYSHYICQRH